MRLSMEALRRGVWAVQLPNSYRFVIFVSLRERSKSPSGTPAILSAALMLVDARSDLTNRVAASNVGDAFEPFTLD